MLDYEAPIEGTRAISVPVIWRGTSIGAVPMIFLRDVAMTNQLQIILLPRLKGIAAEIGQHFILLDGLADKQQ